MESRRLCQRQSHPFLQANQQILPALYQSLQNMWILMWLSEGLGLSFRMNSPAKCFQLQPGRYVLNFRQGVNEKYKFANTEIYEYIAKKDGSTVWSQARTSFKNMSRCEFKIEQGDRICFKSVQGLTVDFQVYKEEDQLNSRVTTKELKVLEQEIQITNLKLHEMQNSISSYKQFMASSFMNYIDEEAAIRWACTSKMAVLIGTALVQFLLLRWLLAGKEEKTKQFV